MNSDLSYRATIEPTSGASERTGTSYDAPRAVASLIVTFLTHQGQVANVVVREEIRYYKEICAIVERSSAGKGKKEDLEKRLAAQPVAATR